MPSTNTILASDVLTPSPNGVTATHDAANGEAAAADAARERCRSYLERLPAAALKEAEDALAEMYEYYSSPPVPAPADPPSQPVKAKMGTVRVRKVYPATGED